MIAFCVFFVGPILLYGLGIGAGRLLNKFIKYSDSIFLRIIVDIVVFLPYLLIIWGITITSFKSVKIYFNGNTKCFIALFYLIAYLILIFLKNKNMLKFFKDKKTQPANNEDSEFNKKRKEEGYILNIIILVCLSILIISCTSIPYMSALSGRMVRESIFGLSKDRIEYSVDKEKKAITSIVGNLVAQADNTYYISKFPERKLFSIRSGFINLLPCEKLVINHRPNQLKDIIYGQINKNGSLLNNPLVTFINDPTKAYTSSENKLEYSFELLVKDADNRKDFIKGMILKYSLNNRNEPSEFEISIVTQYPKNYDYITQLSHLKSGIAH